MVPDGEVSDERLSLDYNKTFCPTFIHKSGYLAAIFKF